MSDSTSVTLTVLSVHVERVSQFTDEYSHEDGPAEGLLTEVYFEEINNGNLRFLNDLREAGIPYDSHWSQGDNYGAGAEHFRIDPEGNMLLKEIYDSGRNPELTLLLEFISQPEKLKQVILDHVEKVSAPSWDNQDEYSKIYRMKKLITPV